MHCVCPVHRTGLNWINYHGDTSFASDNVTVHVAMATCDNGITGIVNLLKSAILFKEEEVNLHLHVVADDKSIGLLEEEVQSNLCDFVWYSHDSHVMFM